MGKTNSKDLLLHAIKTDKETEVKKILTKYPDLKNMFINKNNDHTSLCMAAYYGSLVATKTLVEEGHDINQPEKKEESTPLIIAAKRNWKSIVTFLIEKGADLKHVNNLNLNALDYAVIHGNYEIAFLLKNKNEVELKVMDTYIDLNKEMQVPCFNIPLFYQTLSDNIEPSLVPSFHLTNEEKQNLEGKIPDPNETWANFFRRCVKFELYQPPLVDKNSVPLEKRQSMFVRMQTKLLEMEFNKTIDLNEDNNKVDIESGIEMKNRVCNTESTQNAPNPYNKHNQVEEKKNAEVMDEVLVINSERR